MNVRVEQHITTIAISALALMVVSGIGYGLYSSHKKTATAAAHDLFMTRLSAFHADSPDLKGLTEHLPADYEQYKNTAFGGFFLALQAEIEQELGRKQEALALMDKAVSSMSGVDPVLYYTYATKHALMQLDDSEPSVQTKGRHKLEKLAYTTKNPVRDMALFYMGYQAFMDNDQQAMQVTWGKLFDAHRNPLSAWGMRAQELLNYSI